MQCAVPGSSTPRGVVPLIAGREAALEGELRRRLRDPHVAAVLEPHRSRQARAVHQARRSRSRHRSAPTAWQNFATAQPIRPDPVRPRRTKRPANSPRRLQGHVTHLSFVSSRRGSSPPARTNLDRRVSDEDFHSKLRREQAGDASPPLALRSAANSDASRNRWQSFATIVAIAAADLLQVLASCRQET